MVTYNHHLHRLYLMYTETLNGGLSLGRETLCNYLSRVLCNTIHRGLVMPA